MCIISSLPLFDYTMNTNLRFFLYVRKSGSAKNRQVLSIPAQIEEMQAFSRQHGIQIVSVFQEARTAKEPGRPVFNDMLDRIEKGEANGILSWKIDRIARNPVDDGRISWMLQKGVIRKIQTIERSYLPEDNVLFMRMEQGMATQYIRDLGTNVARGMRKKANNGWMPVSLLPIGYRRNSDKDDTENVIIKDHTRFTIVQELWKLYATGAYSIKEIKDTAERLGLKSIRGNRISMNSYHLMFRNPFYAGYFYWKDIDGNKIRIEGKHPPMIPEAQFLVVQDIIQNRGRKTRPKQYQFPYKNLLTCGECSGHITAERKHRTTCTKCRRRFSSLHKKACPSCGLEISKMKNPLVFDKIYYRCTKTKNPNCSQKTISQESIETTICEALSKLEINQSFYKWAKQKINEVQPFDKTEPILIDSLKKKRNEINKKMANLLDLRVSGEISKEQNNSLHERYMGELDEINKEIVTRESRFEQWKIEANQYLEFAKNCMKRFKSASDFEKKEIVSVFFSSQRILDKNLYFSTKKPLKAILPDQTGTTSF